MFLPVYLYWVYIRIRSRFTSYFLPREKLLYFKQSSRRIPELQTQFLFRLRWKKSHIYKTFVKNSRCRFPDLKSTQHRTVLRLHTELEECSSNSCVREFTLLNYVRYLYTLDMFALRPCSVLYLHQFIALLGIRKPLCSWLMWGVVAMLVCVCVRWRQRRRHAPTVVGDDNKRNKTHFKRHLK